MKGKEIPGAVTSGARIIGDMFSASYPLNREYGLKLALVLRYLKGNRHRRELRVTVVGFPNLNRKYHDRDRIFGVCLKDLLNQPVPVELRATPAFVPFTP